MESGANNSSKRGSGRGAGRGRGGGQAGDNDKGNEPPLPKGNEDEDWGVPTGPDVAAVPMASGITYDSMREEWKGSADEQLYLKVIAEIATESPSGYIPYRVAWNGNVLRPEDVRAT